MTAPTVVFDLDGTLIDTAPDLIDTLNTMLAGEGLPPMAYAEARAMIGRGARKMIEGALAAQSRAPPKADLDRMVDEFIAHYAAHIADRSRPFPGLEEAMDALAHRGCRFAVCTNKREGLSVMLLERLGLAARFAAICGADTFAIAKPDPEILRRTIARASGRLRHAVMVGDSAIDVAAARGAGIPIVAVEFGYSEIAPAELNADRLIGSFEHLPQAVLELLDDRAG